MTSKKKHQIFLSAVLIVRNQQNAISDYLKSAISVLDNLATDYELIVIDNASTDNTVKNLRALVSNNGLPNIQVSALTKEVDFEVAACAGIESCLGDYVAVLNPLYDDFKQIERLIDTAISGVDVVFAYNEKQPRTTLPYRACAELFNFLYKTTKNIDIAKDSPQYRLMSRKVVNYILQHSSLAGSYRHLPITGGFSKQTVRYTASVDHIKPRRLKESFDRGIKLLISSTRAPIRIANFLCVFAAFSNIIYSFYVVLVGVFKSDVTPGWVTLSLQQSGMFFLISLVLLILSEYVANMIQLNGNNPSYHVANEFNSAKISRHEKLNIELANTAVAQDEK